MRFSFLSIFLYLTALLTFGQAKTTWQAGYKLSVLDFQAELPQPEERSQTFHLAAKLDFSEPKSLSEYRQIKNFNPVVKVYFFPSLSWLSQGEGTEIFLKYAQLEFDLLELYARKFRRELYNKRKSVISPEILKEVHQEIKAQMARRQAEMQKALAESDAQGEVFHRQILLEINQLANFCQECPPPK